MTDWQAGELNLIYIYAVIEMFRRGYQLGRWGIRRFLDG